MNAMPASHTPYDNFKLEQTECALALSPRAQIEPSKDIGETAKFASNYSGPERRRQGQSSRQTVLDEHDLTETLTIGWAIALAIAVALAVYVSGG